MKVKGRRKKIGTNFIKLQQFAITDVVSYVACLVQLNATWIYIISRMLHSSPLHH